jgi:hypothetical protein
VADAVDPAPPLHLVGEAVGGDEDVDVRLTRQPHLPGLAQPVDR